MSEKIIVSACLAGVICRYNAVDVSDARVVELVKSGRAVAVCPERLGGLGTPREPCERVGDRVVMKSGRDVTREFERGAEEAEGVAERHGCARAVLKSGSPSCGTHSIHDGTFSGVMTSGHGMFAERLLERGFEVRSEKDDLSDWTGA